MKVLIRCDAHLSIGTGHVMRCLAIAQELADSGHHPYFAFSTVADQIISRLKKEGFDYFVIKAKRGSLADARQTIKLAGQIGAVWVITDGYHFKTDYQWFIKQAGFDLLCVDDVAGCRYVADIILNQNPGFSRSDYSAGINTKFLLGPNYALLRREFHMAGKKQQCKKNNNILVTMGGTDPNDLTSQVLEALITVALDKVTVLIGSMNPNKEHIKKIVQKFPFPVELITDAENVVPYMKRARLVIHAAGSTSWELAYFGVPSICFILAENQEPVASALAKAEYSVNAGWFSAFSPKKMRQMIVSLLDNKQKMSRMAAAGRRLVAGLGPRSVVEAMIEKMSEKTRLKPASSADMKNLFNWRNDFRIRKNFFDQAPVSWDQHQKWFKDKIRESETSIYTAFYGNEKVGSIRFERKEGRLKTSIMLNPAYLGRGLGRLIIKKGVKKFIGNKRLLEPIRAEIKNDNIASIKAFKGAGFRYAGRGSGFVALEYKA